MKFFKGLAELGGVAAVLPALYSMGFLHSKRSQSFLKSDSVTTINKL
jgi:F0F1-type ATP synthase assembly protein I